MNALPKRVFVCSRLRATPERTTAENVARARRLCQAASRAGAAPIAPHLLYPQWLDDSLPEERVQGVNSGLAWLAVSDEVWVDRVHGLSSGMQAEIEAARVLGVRVVVDPECWRGVS